MSPLDEARALVGGDGPAAERVAAVVAERDELRERHAWADERRIAAEKDAIALRARLAAYESASAEASTETLAALDALDAVAGMECDGPEEALSNQQARAIREHLRWLTTRYQREHVERERAERLIDVYIAGRNQAEQLRDLAMTWGRVIVEGAAWAAMGRRAERLTEQSMRDEIAASWRAERDAALERGVRLGMQHAAAQARDVARRIRDEDAEDTRATELENAAWCLEYELAESGHVSAIVAAARERESARRDFDAWADELGDPGGTALAAGPAQSEQPRAELGETDAGEGE